MDDRKGILVVFPREMKRRIVRIAQANASNVNDTVVSMLAVEFGVEFEPTNVRSEAGLEAVRVLLRVPPQLKRAIQLYALDMSSNMTAIIVTTISKRIGMTVKMTPPRRTTPFGGGSGRPGRRPRRRAGTS